MNIVIGLLLGVGAGLFGSLAGLDRERSFYVVMLVVVASYYVLFAAMAGSAPALWLEAAVMGAFVALAVTGFKRSMWIVAAGLLGHGAQDLFHGALIDNAGTPGWWPLFCAAFDVAAGLYLAVLIMFEEAALTEIKAAKRWPCSLASRIQSEVTPWHRQRRGSACGSPLPGLQAPPAIRLRRFCRSWAR